MAFGISATGLFVGGAALVGGYLASQGSSDAANTAAQASREASAASVAEQRRQYDTSRADYAPYLAAGTESVNQLATDLRPGGRFASPTPFDFRYDPNTDPGYGFRFSEGMKGLDRSAASRGGLLSGATLRGATRFGQDLAAGSRQNAFNEYVTGFNANTGERNQLYNRYAGVAGTGQNAVGSVTSQGANAAGNIGNAYMTSAANTGNAALAAAGQRTSAFGGVGNVLGRMYGGYGRGSDPYSMAAMANQQYGAGNVYGYGGGGYTPSQDEINAAFARG
jgi:hypothetical protein